MYILRTYIANLHSTDQNQSVPRVAIMPSKASIITTFEVDKVIQPIYTGGDVALDKSGRVLATCLGEEALITDLNNGDLLARVEGVRSITIAVQNDLC